MSDATDLMLHHPKFKEKEDIDSDNVPSVWPKYFMQKNSFPFCGGHFKVTGNVKPTL